MEVVPPYILNNILKEGKTVFKESTNDEVITSYASVMAQITDVLSYSARHRKLRKVEMQPSAKEKRTKRVSSIKKSVEAKTQYTSDFLNSPLLQSVIFDGGIISNLVERILVSEEDGVLRALSRLVLNFVKMADADGIWAMWKNNLLDGIDSLLVRCQSCEGLTDAITSLQLAQNMGKNIQKKKYLDWEKDFKKYNFESVLGEIAVGNKIRGIVREEMKTHSRPFMDRPSIQCEIEEEEEMCLSSPLNEVADEKIQREDRIIDENCENDNNRKMNDKEKEKEKEKTKIIVASAEQHPCDEKRKQKVELAPETTFEACSCKMKSSTSKPGVGTELYLSQASAFQKVKTKSFLPYSVRLKAIRALSSEWEYLFSFKSSSNYVRVIADGLMLPEGAEEEYLKRKKRNSQEDVSKGEKENDSFDKIDEYDDIIELSNGNINILQIQDCIYCLKYFIKVQSLYLLYASFNFFKWSII
eukprot:MONOS_462.1-p1 / transcript=MONOS_462.1 / gene=MONOS_462 / organism=Monocercomonoides_exilis_PA203 / gene_product=unspecified product / transcript_product=unspecified product / location=Mono_scaffold00007:184374-185789(+) / protein_length=472 / sequence_SO=supercontig / SO=protein_coding / is_pseudo=false